MDGILRRGTIESIVLLVGLTFPHRCPTIQLSKCASPVDPVFAPFSPVCCLLHEFSTKAAINKLNGQMLDGRTLTVNEAKPREERSGGGGGGGGYRGGGGGGGSRW
jgi:hypothetical protein